MIYTYNKSNYLLAWKIILTSLLGWTEEAVENWAHRWGTHLDTGEGGFYHELPGYYLTDLLLERYRKDHASRSLYQRKFNKVADYIDFLNDRHMWEYGINEISAIDDFLKRLN
jgi:hypothetical protein